MDKVDRLFIMSPAPPWWPGDDYGVKWAADAGLSAGEIARVPNVCRRALVPGDLAGMFDGVSRAWVGGPRVRSLRALLVRAGVDVNRKVLRWTEVPDPPLSVGAGGQPPWADEPWYPVIDEERCNGCGQCRSYCLFGVYERAERGIPSVTNPLACKPGCPACARICPRGALLFPMHPDPPINGSGPAAAFDADRTGEGIEAENVVDPYRLLRSRQRRTPSPGLVDLERLRRARGGNESGMETTDRSEAGAATGRYPPEKTV